MNAQISGTLMINTFLALTLNVNLLKIIRGYLTNHVMECTYFMCLATFYIIRFTLEDKSLYESYNFKYIKALCIYF